MSLPKRSSRWSTVPTDRRICAARRGDFALAALIALATAACGGARPGDESGPAAPNPAERPIEEQSTLVPPGYGTLRQDDIALLFQLQGVQVKAIPLDESVIRMLSPDSYRALRELVGSRREEIDELAARRGVRAPSLWYVSFFGLEPEARFSPMEFVITSAGREFRPLELLPLTTGFGQQRLRQREVQSAIYVFEDGLDVEQPLVATVETQRNAAWAQVLRRIERERALIRSRAASPRPPA